MNFDISNITDPTEFRMVDGHDLEEAAKQALALMAYNQAIMNENAAAYQEYLIAKEAYSHYRQIGSVLQTLIRVGS